MTVISLLEALTPMVRESLRKKAIGRLAEHFGEEVKWTLLSRQEERQL
jgi:hypothetical protein